MSSLFLLHSRSHIGMNQSMTGINYQLLLGVVLVLFFAAYIIAVLITNQRYKKWPFFRALSWT